MDSIYYWLGFVIFWLWCVLLVYCGAHSLIAWRRERREEKRRAETDGRLN